ncbi:hypothetical protein, partial [Microbispora hainanensis]
TRTASATPKTSGYAPAAPPPDEAADSSTPLNFEEPLCLTHDLVVSWDAERAALTARIADPLFRRPEPNATFTTNDR